MLPPMLFAGALAAGIAIFVNHAWDHVFGHQTLITRLGSVFLPMTTATLAYWLVALAFKIQPAIEMGNLLLQKMPFKKQTA
jgi:hypothetical protein